MLQSVAAIAEDNGWKPTPANPHAFRQSFITRLLRQRRPETQIARIVGHKSTQMMPFTTST